MAKDGGKGRRKSSLFGRLGPIADWRAKKSLQVAESLEERLPEMEPLRVQLGKPLALLVPGYDSDFESQDALWEMVRTSLRSSGFQVDYFSYRCPGCPWTKEDTWHQDYNLFGQLLALHVRLAERVLFVPHSYGGTIVSHGVSSRNLLAPAVVGVAGFAAVLRIGRRHPRSPTGAPFQHLLRGYRGEPSKLCANAKRVLSVWGGADEFDHRAFKIRGLVGCQDAVKEVEIPGRGHLDILTSEVAVKKLETFVNNIGSPAGEAYERA